MNTGVCDFPKVMSKQWGSRDKEPAPCTPYLARLSAPGKPPFSPASARIPDSQEFGTNCTRDSLVVLRETGAQPWFWARVNSMANLF